MLNIETIVFSGNTAVSDENLLRAADIKVPQILSENDLRSRIEKTADIYRQNGYLYISIDTIIITGAENDIKNVEVSISEGEQFLFGNVNIVNEDQIDDVILRKGIPQYGDVFNRAVLELYIEEAKDYFTDNGFPYFKVVIEDTEYLHEEDEKTIHVEVKLRIDKGGLTKIDRISIAGLEYSRPETIIRESRISQGDVFSEDKLKKAREYISSLSFVESAGEPQLYEDSLGNSVLVMEVDEMNSNRFNGLVGYVPSSGRKDGYYIGSFMIDLGNILGTGRKFQADWNKQDESSQDMRIYYEEPWLAGLPLDLSGQFLQVFQDSSYIKRGFTIGMKYSLSSRINAHLSFGGESVIAEDQGQSLYDLRNSKSTFYTVGLTYNMLDDRMNPSKGISYSSFVTQQRRKLETTETDEGNSVNDRKITAQLESAFPVRGSLVAYGKVAWRETTNSQDDIPLNEKWFLGGARSIRGYREKQFLASRVAWYNIELRYLLEKRSRIFIFWDGGYFQDPGTEYSRKYGYGFGIRLNSRLGMVGFDFGLGKGDSLNSAKLHFMIENSF
ncbi:MAG: BamA/TamA family outer membrane protein [bacterium]|nr:BamA/TamA family outer membrane protein [bacterium]